MYHTKKIGVFISHIFGYYQKNVCQGILDKATEFGYCVEIFTSLDGENIGQDQNGDSHILTLPNYNSYCGIIFVSGTYLSSALKEQILFDLKEKVSCPIIEVTSLNPSFPCVSLSNNPLAYELVNHFVTVHNARRICYFGSTIESDISKIRQSFYQNGMSNHGLFVDSFDVYDGGYDISDAKAALLFFTSHGMFDAIICYNDRMALNFMQAAFELGYQIPNDFKIAGFDDTFDGQNIFPTLTSVSFPVYELGNLAIVQLQRMLQNEVIEPILTIPSKLCVKESCGCHQNTHINPLFHIQSLNHYTSNLESSMIKTMGMSVEFQHITDVDEGMLLFKKYIAYIDHLKEFYLCLYPEWDYVNSELFDIANEESSPSIPNNEMLLKLGIKDKKELPQCTFQKDTLIPSFSNDNATSSYIFTPLFFEDKNFGYLALSYEDNQIDYHFQLISWVMNINQMLQGIRKIKFTSFMEQKLKDIYLKDQLTGFYNLQGYQYYSSSFLESCTSGKHPILCVVFHLHRLKDIIELYGHLEGDFALQIFSQAVAHHIKNNDFCSRLQEDTFLLFTLDSSEDELHDLLQKIERYLANYNSLSSKEYTVNAQIGSATAQKGEQPSKELLHRLSYLAQEDLRSTCKTI